MRDEILPATTYGQGPIHASMARPKGEFKLQTVSKCLITALAGTPAAPDRRLYFRFGTGVE